MDEVKADIKATKAKISAAETHLASAISAGKEDSFVIALTNNLTAFTNNLTAQRNNLTELQKKENILLAGSGDLLSYWRSISMS